MYTALIRVEDKDLAKAARQAARALSAVADDRVGLDVWQKLWQCELDAWRETEALFLCGYGGHRTYLNRGCWMVIRRRHRCHGGDWQVVIGCSAHAPDAEVAGAAIYSGSYYSNDYRTFYLPGTNQGVLDLLIRQDRPA